MVIVYKVICLSIILIVNIILITSVPGNGDGPNTLHSLHDVKNHL